jgi:formylglycine-generating enzyme required for sulfatase activity
MGRQLKTIFVVVGALVVTAFGIDAADTLRGENGTMLAQLVGRETEECPTGMLPVRNVPGVACVDAYEASPNEGCSILSPQHMLDTQRNLSVQGCAAASKEGNEPWRFVTRDQAMQLCARSEKRLPTSVEWYALALGMADGPTTCNTATRSVAPTGSFAECISPHGAYDLVGNVWEWVRDDVINGTYKERALPETGYVAQVDENGMAVASTDTPDQLFNADYFWSQSEGAYGIIRGGYYDSGNDAGVYAVHADTLPTSASPGIGFRCVRDTL